MAVTLDRTFACLPQTTRGETIQLTAHPKGQSFLYCSGKYVIIRNIDDPSKNDVYSEHGYDVTVAKYSPSTFYIASADKTGRLRIWDTTQAEHILKNEFHPISGPIRSLDWDAESKRIVVAGDGCSTYVKVISCDMGTNLGEMAGHMRKANSVAFKPTRPLRIASGAEDFRVHFYEGPPFKSTKNHTVHSNFVNVVTYAPNGSFFVSGSADKRIFAFDGKTGDKIGEVGMPAHAGGIYGLSFSQNSEKLVSVSGDKTMKVWDVSKPDNLPEQPIATYSFGTALDDMQVACVWAREDTIITVSLSSTINFFNPEDVADGPRRCVLGHNKPITAMMMLNSGQNALTASTDGRMAIWDLRTGVAKYVTGDLHTNQVQAMAVTPSNCLASVGLDDTLRYTSLNNLKCGAESARKLDSQPKSLASAGDVMAIGCLGKVILLKGGHDFATIPVSFEPLSMVLNECALLLVVGGDEFAHIYDIPSVGSNCVEQSKIKFSGNVQSLAFSPDGRYLTVTTSNGMVNIRRVSDWSSVLDFGYHNARVDCCAWSPNSKMVATGGLDTNLIVWFVENTSKRIIVKSAHPKSSINGVGWSDDSTVVTCGQDGSLRIWHVSP